MLRSAWRVAAPLFVVVLLSACGSRAAAQSRCASPEGALPAGMYWTTIGWYDYELPCPPPSVAVVEGVYQNAASAQQAVRRVPSMAFEPGFPWVVEARRAGLEADGVAVVLGWFEREEQARRWSTSRRRGHTPNLVRVLPVRQALSRLPPSYVEDGASEPRQVVWVPRGATAYRFSDETDERGSVVRSTRTVACEVPKESVFEFAARQWRSHEPFAWMPVRCGADVAWVERAATSQESVSYVDSEGRIRVTQVTEVECDSPSYTTWEVDETGRRLNPQTEAGSCGEP